MMILRWLLLACCVSTCVASAQVAVSLRAAPTAAVGEEVPLEIVFTNMGDDALYVPFSGADYGVESLLVCAEKDGLWYRSGQTHFDRDVAAFRFDYVPLRHGQTFSSPILGINYPGASSLPVLRLPEPGKYSVSVRYTSAGSSVVGVLWPVWRGTVTSTPLELVLTERTRATVNEKRRALAECAHDASTCDDSLIGYFAIVRDDDAASLLIQLLDRTDVPDPGLLAAVVNQPGEAPRSATARFVKRFPRYQIEVDELTASSTSAAAACAKHTAAGTGAAN